MVLGMRDAVLIAAHSDIIMNSALGKERVPMMNKLTLCSLAPDTFAR